MKIKCKLDDLPGNKRAESAAILKKNLAALPGVLLAEIDNRGEYLSLMTEQHISLEDIIKALYQSGYLE